MSAHDEQQAKILEEMAVQIQCAVEMVGPRDYVPTVEELAREMAPQLATVAAVRAGAAALRASPETGWQPMETAPKDGTHVLVADWDGAAFFVFIASYVQFGDDPPAGYRNGWCNGWDGDYLDEDDTNLTHWMSLPTTKAMLPEVPHA